MRGIHHRWNRTFFWGATVSCTMLTRMIVAQCLNEVLMNRDVAEEEFGDVIQDLIHHPTIPWDGDWRGRTSETGNWFVVGMLEMIWLLNFVNRNCSPQGYIMRRPYWGIRICVIALNRETECYICVICYELNTYHEIEHLSFWGGVSKI